MTSNNPPLTDEMFGSALRRAREGQALTLEQLSRLLTDIGEPLAVTVLSRIERGARSARAGEVVAIARVLGMSAGDLLDAADPQQQISRADAGVSAALRGLENLGKAFAQTLAGRIQMQPETFTTPKTVGATSAVGEGRAAVERVFREMGLSGLISQPDDHDPDA